MSRYKVTRIGNTSVNHSDIQGLKMAWQEGNLVPFLGAGVSIDYGVPGWKNLILELLFRQTARARRMKTFLPHYRRALTSWLADYFDYDPVILARVIKTDVVKKSRRKAILDGETVFLETIRSLLYENLSVVRPRTKTTLKVVADFIQVGVKENRIPAVVSFNFDDLLECELEARNVPFRTCWQSSDLRGEGFRVIHPHGFLPRQGDVKNHGVVFTEREYHQLSETSFHWAITEIISYLRHNHAVFIGLSLSDPNLRRLLDATRTAGIPPHWHLQKRHEIRDQEKEQVMKEIEYHAGEYGRLLGDGILKNRRELSEAIDASLKQADSYDDQLFESMGVKTIWLQEYSDLDPLLRAIIN